MKYKASLNQKNIFALFLTLYTILNGYSIGIGNFSIAMFLCIVYSAYGYLILIKSRQIKIGKNGAYLAPFLFVIALALFSLISLFLLPNYQIFESSMLFNFSKLLVWASIISFTAYLLFDYKLFIKWMFRVGLIVNSYLFLQNIFHYFFSKTLTNVFNIGPLKPNYEGYGVIEEGFLQTSNYRPSSFFGEPAYFGYFIIIILVVSLFDENVKHGIKSAIFFSLGILLSTSSGAIYIMILVWGIYILLNSPILVKTFGLFTSILIGLIVASLGIGNAAIFQGLGKFGNALQYAIEKVQNIENLARVGGSFEKIESFLQGYQIFWGKGIGNQIELGYLNSIATLIAWNGLLGIFLFIIFLISFFTRKIDKVTLVLIFVYIVNGFYSGMYLSIHSIMYIVLIAYKNVPSNNSSLDNKSGKTDIFSEEENLALENKKLSKESAPIY